MQEDQSKNSQYNPQSDNGSNSTNNAVNNASFSNPSTDTQMNSQPEPQNSADIYSQDAAYDPAQLYDTTSAYNPQNSGPVQFTQFDPSPDQQYTADPVIETVEQSNPEQKSYENTGYQDFSQPSTEQTTVPPLDQQFGDSSIPMNSPDNTFTQKRTGSKLFMYGSIAVVVILLIAMGVLSYYNFFAPGANNTNNSNQDSTAQVSQTDSSNNNSGNDDDSGNSNNSNNTSNDQNQSNTTTGNDDGSTGGNTTPASQSRKNSDSQIPKEWLLQHFVRPEIDLQGNCLNLNVCGNQADPDNDGATNIIEYNFGTDPLEADTDKDSLADGDELFVYFTSATSDKSDSDNFADGTETTGCYDPTSPSAAKMTSQRRTQIASNVTLKPLHEPTITLLKNAGATQSDIINRGIPLSACPTDSTTPTTTTPTNTTTNNGGV